MMLKILIINTIGLNYEGITSVILNYTSHMGLQGLELDFLAQPEINTDLKGAFQKIGNIVYATKRKESVTKYIRDLRKLLRQKKYDIVHIHGNSGTMVLEVAICRMSGIKNVIIHTHNTKSDHPIVNEFFKYPMIHGANKLLACSNDAGKWLFGNKEYIVLNNAIDTNRFRFSLKDREKIRKELGFSEEDYIIGHSGHFTEQKNQAFLINVLHILKDSKIKLLLLSDGPKLESIKKLAEEIGINEKVIFAGRRSDPERYYQAMDMFAFPSKWEGLGLVLVEAQASGLPCIASTAVPRESNVTGKVQYIDLDAELWAEAITKELLNQKNREKESTDNVKWIVNNGFDIAVEAKKLERIYRGEET